MTAVLSGNTILGLGAVHPCSGVTTGVGVPPGCDLGAAFVPVGLTAAVDAHLHPVLVTTPPGGSGVLTVGGTLNLFDLSCAATPRCLSRLGNTIVWQPVTSVASTAPQWRLVLPKALAGTPVAPRQRVLLASATDGTVVIGAGPSGQLQGMALGAATASNASCSAAVTTVYFFFTAAADALVPAFQLPVWTPSPIIYQFPSFWPRPFPPLPGPWPSPWPRPWPPGPGPRPWPPGPGPRPWPPGPSPRPWPPGPGPRPPVPPLPPRPPMPPVGPVGPVVGPVGMPAVSRASFRSAIQPGMGTPRGLHFGHGGGRR